MTVQAPQCAEMEALILLNETLEFSPPSFPLLARGRRGEGEMHPCLPSPLSARLLQKIAFGSSDAHY